MKLTPKGYMPRLIDKEIEENLDGVLYMVCKLIFTYHIIHHL